MSALTASSFRNAASVLQRPPGNAQLICELKRIVGRRHVLTNPSSTRRFRKGFRFGDGPALAVIRQDP